MFLKVICRTKARSRSTLTWLSGVDPETALHLVTAITTFDLQERVFAINCDHQLWALEISVVRIEALLLLACNTAGFNVIGRFEVCQHVGEVRNDGAGVATVAST